LEHPEDSLAGAKIRDPIKHQAGIKMEHILSDDSILRDFIKGDLKNHEMSKERS